MRFAIEIQKTPLTTTEFVKRTQNDVQDDVGLIRDAK